MFLCEGTFNRNWDEPCTCMRTYLRAYVLRDTRGMIFLYRRSFRVRDLKEEIYGML